VIKKFEVNPRVGPAGRVGEKGTGYFRDRISAVIVGQEKNVFVVRARGEKPGGRSGHYLSNISLTLCNRSYMLKGFVKQVKFPSPLSASK
jgi:hypothetical protein